MSITKVICTILLLCGVVACDNPEPIPAPDTTIASLGTPDNNEIWYMTTNAKELELISFDSSAFNAEVVEIGESEFGYGVIRFATKLTSIGERAFANCHNLFNISLPNSVTEIGERSFFECINMECLTLGPQIKRCGDEAFDNCVNLYSLHIYSVKSWCSIDFESPTANPAYYSQLLIVNGEKVEKLHIPEGVTRIGRYAFYNNYFVQEVIMPASMQHVGQSAFADCTNLSKVTTNDIEAWCSIDFEDEMANPLATAGALHSNGGVVSNLVLTSAKEIRPHTFTRCTTLQHLSTADSTESIGLEAFRGCTALVDVTLGASMTSIDAKTFTGCTALKSVTSLATEPPALGDSAFAYNAEGRKIFVPKEAVEAYRSADNWSQYATDIDAIN